MVIASPLEHIYADRETAEFEADGLMHWEDGTVWSHCEMEHQDDTLYIVYEKFGSAVFHEPTPDDDTYMYSCMQYWTPLPTGIFEAAAPFLKVRA